LFCCSAGCVANSWAARKERISITEFGRLLTPSAPAESVNQGEIVNNSQKRRVRGMAAWTPPVYKNYANRKFA